MFVTKRNVFTATAAAAVLAAMLIAASNLSFAGTDDSVSEAAFIVISLVNQNPDPVMPGEAIELKFKVENRGTKLANDVFVELIPRYPFVVDETEMAKPAGSLFGRQKGKDAVTVRFFLKADENAGYGFNQFALRYKTASQGWTVVDGFNVSIGRRDLPLTVSSVSSEPEVLVPGERSKLKLEIWNAGSGEAVNVRVRLNLSDSTPFAAYGSTNEVLMPAVSPKGASTAAFEIITSPDAKSSVYRVPVLITYSDGSGRNYTVSGQSFGVSVGSTPAVEAAVVSQEPVKLNSKAKVTVELINKGLTDLKFFTVRLEASGSYEAIFPESVYIGDLDSGDSETVSYDVFFTKQAPLLLGVDYSDALNSKHQQQLEVPVKVYTSAELGKFGLEKRNSKGILVTAAIVAFGVLAYRKLRKKKQGR